MTQRRAGAFDKAAAVFRKHGGLLRTTAAIEYGIHPRVLYAMRDGKAVEQLARGVYRLAGLPKLGNPDLVTVAIKAPQGVVCLISALAFHEITTQIPREVHIAIPRDSKGPRIEYPPVRVYVFSGKAHAEGIETRRLDGVPVKIYSPEKTLADCFKYRNKVGLDTAIEAVRLYRERKPVKVGEIMRFARVCRIARVMQPYLESLL
jgi:predicted transcriptional regulator of viral defense system